MTVHTPVDPELEAQYNNMARRPDAAERLAEISERSAAYRAQAEAQPDCSYGEHEREKIDVFYCGSARAPLLVYLHGGYWQRGDRSMYSYLAEPFNAAGVDVAIVGYPLCPEVSMTRITQSIRAALIWLWRNAGALGIDAERINLSGHSAGGHLTAMALATHWPDLDSAVPTDLLRSAIPISGLYRLEPLLPTTISHVLDLSREEITDLSPVNLAAHTDCPIQVIVGGSESAQFFDQADGLIDAWSRPGLTIDKYIEADGDHFDVILRLGDPASDMFSRVYAWLR